MRLLIASLFLGLGLMAGCGGSSGSAKAKVTGKVTVAGKGPLTGGNIRFVLASDTSKGSGGIIKADGSYEVVDAPVGECKVTIDNEHLKVGGSTGGDGKKVITAPKGVDIPGGDVTANRYMKIESSFTKADTTSLTFTVPSGGGSKDFEVK